MPRLAARAFAPSLLVCLACQASFSAGTSTQAGPAAPASTPDAADAPGATAALQYPASKRVDHVDTYHGVQVPDPYRWLEDIDSGETQKWVEAQNKVTFAYLNTIGERQRINERLSELWDYERWGVPGKLKDLYVVSRNDGLQNQSVIYMMTSLDAEPKVLLDPNKLSADGTVALQGLAFTEDESKFAYGVSEAGSDWQVWRVRDVKTGKELPDEIRWIKFGGVSWKKDGSGFFYSRYPEAKDGDKLEQLNEKQQVLFHKLGDPQSKDQLIYARPDRPKWGFSPGVTEDGRYLIIRVRLGTSPKSSVFFQDLSRRSRKTVELLPDFKAKYTFVGNNGPKFWFLTDDEAPLGRLIEIDVRKPARKHWKELIPQTKATLRGVSVVGDRFFASYLDNAHSRVTVFKLDGAKERDVALPGLGSVGGFLGKRTHNETFFAYTSFANPPSIYRYDIKTGKVSTVRKPEIKFNPDDYETKQVFFESKDGTKVPMFISHKKGLKLDGNNPTYLYGYGGFNIPLTPSFSVPNLVWMEMGGVYAMPNLRGGGEFGEEWHAAGTKLQKQNVFDDFIAAAQWLMVKKYTRKEKLAIGGRSNGGLLVGATMTQRPDLFAAALPGVGVMDMLRFNKFTIGWAWESDYGSPKNAAEFTALRAYSPYHNLQEGTEYPATMVHTADHDDRVVPAHSYKFAAALQHAHEGNNPVLIRIETKAGHGAGKPTAKIIEEWTDLWGFLVANLDMKVPG